MRPKKYKLYLRGDHVSKIPISTLRRWNTKEINEEEESLLAENISESTDRSSSSSSFEDSEEMEYRNDDEEFETNSVPGSYTSSTDSLVSDEETSETLNDEFVAEMHDPLSWINEKLYVAESSHDSELRVGEIINEILNLFIYNGMTKKSLGQVLKIINLFLPKPNNFTKNMYRLSKLLDTLLPANDIVKKHGMCSNCGHYLGHFSSKSHTTITCDDCKIVKEPNIFIEYDMKQLIIDAFEKRNLKNLIDEFKKKSDPNIICDFTSGAVYKKLKENVIKGNYDLCLLWNTDGAPVSKSSNGQIWPIQVKILNIPENKRRAYQFLVGLYYSNESKPPMSSFLKPFADCLKNLYEDGIEWFDKTENKINHSVIIAPIATLDCPARASVQNLMQFNGQYGCTLCEHPGISCATGLGHARVYPVLKNDPPLRSKDSIISQANTVVLNGLEHLKGVKGISITATIPHFDCCSSFVIDYMHAILLGVSRMLFSLWFDGKYIEKEFYIKKNVQDEINEAIKKISPPDFLVRIPRQLKEKNYWKASEIRDFLLFYFPLILEEKLPKKYYKHFLLLVYGTRLLLQEEIHVKDVNLAESLLCLFAAQVKELYGLEKCTFNVHQLTHIANCVRQWGPLWSWSAFSFEDAIGYFKQINHGPNKVDSEIMNTIKIVNAHYILKDKLNVKALNVNNDEFLLGKPIKYNLNVHEIQALQTINIIQESAFNINNILHVHYRAVRAKEIFTSIFYKRQKKRSNSTISWNNKSQYGSVQFFVNINDCIYVIVREYRRLHQKNMIHSCMQLNLCDVLIPMRLTYCYHAVPLNRINEKILFVNNHVCLAPNSYEKK